MNVKETIEQLADNISVGGQCCDNPDTEVLLWRLYRAAVLEGARTALMALKESGE